MRFNIPGVDCSAWPDVDSSSVEKLVASVGTWYHTIELPGALTPGFYDMRKYVDDYRLPNMDGLEVLDVGSSNGFFSFLFESRGAKVTAVDLPSYRDHDYPKCVIERKVAELGDAALSLVDWNELHGGFLVAHHALRSKVERVLTPLYGLPAALEPKFDIVFCSNVLVHLRDPIAALEAIRAVVKPGGRVIVATPILHQDYGDASPANFIGFVDGPAWWVPAPRTLRRWHEVVGFSDIELVNTFDTQRVRGDMQGGHIGVIHASR